MKALWFGGSFNPVHCGHLICARAVAECAGYDRVYLVPSAQAPHKQGHTDVASSDDRVTMLKLAIADEPLFSLDLRELKRLGPSYTIDTARDIRRMYTGRIDWLVGADMAINLPHWHEAAALLSEVHFVLMARPGWEFDHAQMPREYSVLADRAVTTPQLDISSTQIRRRIAAGLSVRFLMPDAVVKYIDERGLYRNA